MAELREAKMYKEKANAIAAQIGDLQVQMREHVNVLDICKDMAPERRCYRLVGGTLLERNVGQVVPALTDQRAKIEMMITKMSEDLQKTEQEADRLIKVAQDIAVENAGLPAKSS
jgi:prefoldin subunit 2